MTKEQLVNALKEEKRQKGKIEHEQLHAWNELERELQSHAEEHEEARLRKKHEALKTQIEEDIRSPREGPAEDERNNLLFIESQRL